MPNFYMKLLSASGDRTIVWPWSDTTLNSCTFPGGWGRSHRAVASVHRLMV